MPTLSSSYESSILVFLPKKDEHSYIFIPSYMLSGEQRLLSAGACVTVFPFMQAQAGFSQWKNETIDDCQWKLVHQTRGQGRVWPSHCFSGQGK